MPASAVEVGRFALVTEGPYTQLIISRKRQRSRQRLHRLAAASHLEKPEEQTSTLLIAIVRSSQVLS